MTRSTSIKKIKFSDHCKVDENSLKAITQQLPERLLFQWHPKVRHVLKIVSSTAACLDEKVKVTPFTRNSGDQADNILRYKQDFLEKQRNLETKLSSISESLDRLTNVLQGTTPEHSFLALQTFSGISALTLISALQEFEGLLVTDLQQVILRLFLDLPRIRKPFLAEPYRRPVHDFVFGTWSFLSCRVHKEGEPYEKWEPLFLPTADAESWQEKENPPDTLYYRWVLPQWLFYINRRQPDPGQWHISVLSDELGRERYFSVDPRPWDREQPIQEGSCYDFDQQQYQEAVLEEGWAVWIWQRTPKKKMTPRPFERVMTFDVGIIIALKEEFTEFHSQIVRQCDIEIDLTTKQHYFLFDRTTIEGSAYKCVATCVGEMGEKTSALATCTLIHKYPPKTIVNIGISGSLSSDVLIGDVVVAKLIDSYLERSKAVQGRGDRDFEFMLSGDPYRPSINLIRLIDNLDFTSKPTIENWKQECSNRMQTDVPGDNYDSLIQKDLIRAAPNVSPGELASGPTVGSSTAFKEWLQNKNRNYTALDMETGGIMTTIYYLTNQSTSLILRGISDFADERKKEMEEINKGALRKYAMQNAIQLLWAVMDNNLLPRIAVI